MEVGDQTLPSPRQANSKRLSSSPVHFIADGGLLVAAIVQFLPILLFSLRLLHLDRVDPHNGHFLPIVTSYLSPILGDSEA